MARTWSRIHEHLGLPPRALVFDDVAAAVAGKLAEAEADVLDWTGLEGVSSGGARVRVAEPVRSEFQTLRLGRWMASEWH